ncbi:MAG: methionine--tRNA ligase [Gammaproteobacteria bacterium]|nr:methionine--tRNA ligase [Gammaproteobacteria bacterium]
MSKPQKMMITSALPYGNGPLHLGHMVEHILTDIWVRTQRLSGHECISICGDDAHGTPIMLKAQQLGITPEQLTIQSQLGHEKDLKAFSIRYDVYHSTHSPENQNIVADVYQKLTENDDILVKSISQAYDVKAAMFLPDRYIKGTCPKCGAEDQYGDNCEKCGAIYQTTDLINPISSVTGTTPEYRDTEHYFFKLEKYADFLNQWAAAGHIPASMHHKLQEWFEAGLQAWDISRDAPYFGFEIPNAPNKYFYVWLDAPIGYIAATLKYCQMHGLELETLWGPDSTYELYHIVGKDIMYFHALFWPAVLKGANYRLPNAIFTHGFLTINGQKMSKSRGTFIQAAQFIKHFPSDCIRYYFAAKLNGGIEDIDLNPEDFVARVNADLIGKVVNIASRSASFIHKYFLGQLAKNIEDQALYQQWSGASEDIFLCYQQQDNAKAVRLTMALADKINQYVDAQKPWVLAKDEATRADVQQICTMALNGFRLLMILLEPILPSTAEKSRQFFNESNWSWQHLDPLLGQTIAPYEPLMNRIQIEQWQAMLDEKDLSA